MDWQILMVILIVTGAAGYLARNAWRTWSAKGGCAAGCGCGKATSAGQNRDARPTFIPTDQITLRQRDGGRR